MQQQFKKYILRIFILTLHVVVVVMFTPSMASAKNKDAQKTIWKVEPSLKLDAITLLGPLSADPFFARTYKNELAYITRFLSPEVDQAIQTIIQTRKKRGGSPAPAWLANIYSAWPGETLLALNEAWGDPDKLKSYYQKTPYYNRSTWRVYLSLRPHIKTYLDFLSEFDFESYWNTYIKTQVKGRSTDTQKYLQKFDVVSEVEKLLGRQLPTRELLVNVLYFNRPQGIKMTGMRYVTNIKWSYKTTAAIAGHELMHPLYLDKRNAEIIRLFSGFKKDNYLMAVLKNRNPTEGNNNFRSFVVENLTQAMDQIVAEKLGLATPAHKRWKKPTSGSHMIIATSLYGIMKEQGFGESDETAYVFLKRILTDGSFKPGDVAIKHAQFMASVPTK